MRGSRSRKEFYSAPQPVFIHFINSRLIAACSAFRAPGTSRAKDFMT